MTEYIELKDGSGKTVSTRRNRSGSWPIDPIAASEQGWAGKRDVLNKWILNNVGTRDDGDQFLIDEVSVYFDMFEPDLLWEYLTESVSEPHVKMFNHSWDQVFTDPIVSEYFVEYFFLEVRDLGMRVEVMRIDRGSSPLHESLSRSESGQTPHTIHYSFKVDDLDDYDKVCRGLKDGGAVFVQGCNSTYGTFSYWRVKDLLGNDTYLKPRVNLRDVSERDQEIAEEIMNAGVPGLSDPSEFAEGHPTFGHFVRDVLRKGKR